METDLVLRLITSGSFFLQCHVKIGVIIYNTVVVQLMIGDDSMNSVIYSVPSSWKKRFHFFNEQSKKLVREYKNFVKGNLHQMYVNNKLGEI